jgi:beta-glucosidase
MVMSDWTGVNSVAESIEAGCDLEMPHSDKWRHEKAIQAIKDGSLSVQAVEDAATNVLYLIQRCRGDDTSDEKPEKEDNRAETRELIRKAGAQGIVLLKNEKNILPLDAEKTKIAVIGPNGNRAVAGGGGSASLNPYYNTIPLDSIRKASKQDVTFAQGCEVFKWVPVATPFCSAQDGTAGATLEFFIGDKFEGKPAVVQHKDTTDLMLWDSAPKSIVGDVYSCRVSATLKPTTTGKHYLSFFSVGPGKLSLDGKVLIDQWNWTKMGDTMYDGAEDEIIEIDLQAGKTYNLVSEFTNEIRPLEKQAKVKKTHAHGGVRIGFAEVETRDLLQEAVEVAKAADVAVVIVGLDAEWESEGYDRPDMHLPKDGTQDRLIEAVRKANPNTIVVVQTGSPVTMPWADSVPAVLQAWYQGQEAGNALADVLFGKANPSGKLPTSFPVRLEDTPTFHNFPGENREVFYGEGVYLGYRHYETVGLKPHWPFGHGLSYTKFEIGDVKLGDKVLKEDGSITVSVPVTNVGKVEGAEVVQVYVRDMESRISRPYKELAGFAKVFLKPGETKEAKVTIDKYSGGVGYFDISLGSDGRGRWIVEDGEFEVLVGSSSVDIRGKASFEAPDSFQWVA